MTVKLNSAYSYAILTKKLVSDRVDLKSAGSVVGGVDSAQCDLRAPVLPWSTTVTFTLHRATCATVHNFDD